MILRNLYRGLLLVSLSCHSLNAQVSTTSSEDTAINPFLLKDINGGSAYKTDPFKKSDSKLLVKIESAGVATDGDNAPFWITSNNYGIGSEYIKKAYLRAGVFTNREFIDNKIKASFGIDMIGAHNLQSDFYVHQWYADFKYRSIGLSIGAKEKQRQFRNMYLTSGNMTLSNNARPIPQIEAGFPDFVNVPLTKEWLQVRGGISYGWFLDSKYKENRVKSSLNYAKDVLYHRKYVYFKLENNTPWSFILGLEMDTQWGGEFYKNGKFHSKSPGNLKNFFKVLVPMEGGSDTNTTDQVNIVGNVWGSWNFIFNYKFKNYTVKAYYENIFEDHSGIVFKNLPDGLYGIEVNSHKKAPFSSLVLEYVHTKNQSGPFLWDKNVNIPIQMSGNDNYYNHVDYISTTNYGMVLGNPLLTSPIYNKNGSLMIMNSRISAFHGGLGGYISNSLQYKLMLTYSRSWGTHLYPAGNIRNQFSSMIEVGYEHPKLSGWMFSGAIAYDDSALMVGDNFGGRFKISKTFDIK